MNEASRGEQWFFLANEDLRSAEHLLTMHPIPIEIICFHCEQAAEKMLKGVLEANDIEPPRTHDLVVLCKLCGEVDEEYLNLIDYCIGLTPYGVQARYPSEMEINENDMMNALDDSRALCDMVDRMLSLNELDEQTEQNMDMGGLTL